MDLRPLDNSLSRGICHPVGDGDAARRAAGRPRRGTRRGGRARPGAAPNASTAGSIPLPAAWSGRGRTHLGDHRCSGRRARLVSRCRVRRRLEVCRQRRHVPPGVGLDAGAGDRRARHRSEQAIDRVGRHGRSVGDSRRGPDGRRRLQVERFGHHLAAHGARRDGAHPAHHRPSDESEHRLRLRARPRDGRTVRARRLQNDRRRRDVEARPLARRQLRMLWAHARREESQGAVRRHVARHHAHVGDVQRHARSQGRRLRVPRRRRHLEAGRRSRAPTRSARQDRRRRSRRRTPNASTR